MRAEIIAYMIYLEGPDFYLKYSGTPKYGNMLGNSLPDWASWSCPRNNRKLPKIFGLSTRKEYVMHYFLHEVFLGIFQVIISNGMVYKPLLTAMAQVLLFQILVFAKL